MHFTTLFVLKGEELDNTSLGEITNLFFDRYCYNCGETTPKYARWCDWFQIGGKWCDLFEANRGIRGERSWCNREEPIEPDKYSIVNIRDLLAPIKEEVIYAIATKSRIYYKDKGEDKFKSLLKQINDKTFKGVIALRDCHD